MGHKATRSVRMGTLRGDVPRMEARERFEHEGLSLGLFLLEFEKVFHLDVDIGRVAQVADVVLRPEADVFAVDAVFRHLFLILLSLGLELRAKSTDARHLYRVTIGAEVVDGIKQSLARHLDGAFGHMCRLCRIVDNLLVVDDVAAHVTKLINLRLLLAVVKRHFFRVHENRALHWLHGSVHNSFPFFF